jgi:hypothetical protein
MASRWQETNYFAQRLSSGVSTSTLTLVRPHTIRGSGDFAQELFKQFWYWLHSTRVIILLFLLYFTLVVSFCHKKLITDYTEQITRHKTQNWNHVNSKALIDSLIVATQALKSMAVAATLLPWKIATYLYIIIKTRAMCSAEINDNICSTSKDSHDNTRHAIPISYVFFTYLFPSVLDIKFKHN